MVIALADTMPTELALNRLFQLISPSLPIGGYTYSQGIEWAVEEGWITNEADLSQWIGGLLQSNLLYLELPVLLRMQRAWSIGDVDQLRRWNAYLVASRETRELRDEERHRARALYQVLLALDEGVTQWRELIEHSQHAGFSYACQHWQIDEATALQGFAWSWMENLVLAAVKIIPLGQSAGQRLLFELSDPLSKTVQASLEIEDVDIGASSMAMVIASASHELQYSRLFRS